jgi:DNA invertase Pin-like site-specific DNA recombinase
MNNSELIQPHHRARKAVIYIRQSSGHQVLSNVESRALQHAMRDRALALGWDESRVEVVEADTGTSAASTAGREGYKLLLSQIVLGLVGLVLSYESTRLSRNYSDWYPLLDVCTDNDCLIADRDGVYDPSSSNGRLLLGMKGIISEVELHTLRGRLVAGILQKAKRGELALKLPIGLLRLPDGRVTKDPNVQIQEAIALVFTTFLERGSTTKVVRHLRESGVRMPRRHPHDEVVWREACVANVLAVLKNPGYAGTFVYGRTRHDARGRSALGKPVQRRRTMDQWRIVVHDRYPAFIPWDTFLKVQAMLQDNYAAYDRNRSRGVPRDGAALLHGIADDPATIDQLRRLHATLSATVSS